MNHNDLSYNDYRYARTHHSKDDSAKSIPKPITKEEVMDFVIDLGLSQTADEVIDKMTKKA